MRRFVLWATGGYSSRLSAFIARSVPPGSFDFAQGRVASWSDVILMACGFCRPEDLCSPRPHEGLRQSCIGPPAPKNGAISMTRGGPLVFSLEAVAALSFNSDCFGYFQKCAGGVREVGTFAVDQAQLALELKLAHWDTHQFSAGEFCFYADLRNQGDPISHRYELFDGLQRR